MRVHDFQERLNFSEGIELSEDMFLHLQASIPRTLAIERTTHSEDRSGVDYWVIRRSLPPVGIDVKHRQFCPIERWGTDDAGIETTSVYTGPNDGEWKDEYRVKPGWTIDDSKKTDLILYTWPADNGSLRYWILYFPFLCLASQRYWRQWAFQYGERAALNDSYITLSVYPPRVEIAKRIKELTTGKT